jgi:hypothetical protein
MITFTVLIIVVLVLIAVWLYDRSREPEEKVATRASQTAAGAYKNLKIPFIGKKKDKGLQVSEWLTEKDRTPAPSAKFKHWLSALSVDEMKSFEKALADFCTSRAFDLGWLMRDDINQDDEMQAALEAAVFNFSQAYWKAAAAQDSIEAFSVYQSWKANPKKGPNKQFGQQLFNLLLQKGLATAPPELFLAEEKERDAYVNKAIMEVASVSPAAFNTAVKEVVATPVETKAKEDQILPASAETDKSTA